VALAGGWWCPAAPAVARTAVLLQRTLGGALTNPHAPPLIVTGPAQAQRNIHPLILTVADFGG